LQDHLGAEQGSQCPETPQHAFQVFTLEQLHDHERKAALRIRARVIDLNDVIALDDRARARFAEKALHDAVVAREIRGEQKLDGAALEGRGVATLVNRAHAALADEPHELVLSPYGLADHFVCNGVLMRARCDAVHTYPSVATRRPDYAPSGVAASIQRP